MTAYRVFFGEAFCNGECHSGFEVIAVSECPRSLLELCKGSYPDFPVIGFEQLCEGRPAMIQRTEEIRRNAT